MAKEAEVRTKQAFAQYVAQLANAREVYSKALSRANDTSLDDDIREAFKAKADASYGLVNRLESRIKLWTGEVLEQALKTPKDKATVALLSAVAALLNDKVPEAPASTETK